MCKEHPENGVSFEYHAFVRPIQATTELIEGITSTDALEIALEFNSKGT